MSEHPSPINPWFAIWLKPRATIARIVASNPNRSLWVLAAIYGFTSLLNFFQTGSLGSYFGPAGILLSAAVLAPFWGYLLFAIWGGLTFWTGRWFKGKAHFTAVRAAYAWSCVPFVFHIPLWFLMAILFGKQLFIHFPEGTALTQSQVTLLFAILIFKVTLAIWSVVIYINALAEVQRYSVFRAILNLVTAGIIAAIFFGILWSLLFYFAGSSAPHSMAVFPLLYEGSSIVSLSEFMSQ